MKRNVWSMVLVAATAAILFGGCWSAEIDRNLANASKLRVGMNKEQVLQIMGEPLVNEIYNTPDRWYYYIECRWHDGLYTQDECLPLLFHDDKLIGWGNEFMARHDAVDNFR